MFSANYRVVIRFRMNDKVKQLSVDFPAYPSAEDVKNVKEYILQYHHRHKDNIKFLSWGIEKSYIGWKEIGGGNF